MSADAPVRVGVVGCGRVVQEGHAPAYAASAGLDVVAVADVSPARRDTVGALLGVPPEGRVATVAELVDAGVDVVVVATPSATHPVVIAELLRAGVGVVSEKPLAPSAAACDGLIAQARAQGVGLGVMHNYGWGTAWRFMLDRVDEGVLGAPHSFTVVQADDGALPGYSEEAPHWRGRADLAGGGCLLDSGYHFVYLAELLLRSPIACVESAVIETTGRGITVEDRADVALWHESGAVTRLSLSWAEPVRRPPTMTVETANGLLVLNEDTAEVVVESAGRRTLVQLRDDPDGFGRALPATIAAVATGGVHLAESGRRVVAVIEAAYRCSRTGRPEPVRLPTDPGIPARVEAACPD